MELSCPLGTTRRVAQEKFPGKPYNKSFIDQACSVKIVGYWPCSFFACLWTSTQSRSINTQKKNELGQYPAVLTSHLVNNPYIQTFQINYSTSANVKLTITISYITSASKTIVLLKTPPKCRKQTKKIKTPQKFTPTLTIFVAQVIMAHIQDG